MGIRDRVRAKEQQAHGALDAATAKADKADAGSRHEEIQTAEALSLIHI